MLTDSLNFKINVEISPQPISFKAMNSQLRASAHCHGQLSCLSSPVTLPCQRAGFPCFPPRKSFNGVLRARTKDWAHCQGPLKDRKWLPTICLYSFFFYLPSQEFPGTPGDPTHHGQNSTLKVTFYTQHSQYFHQ